MDGLDGARFLITGATGGLGSHIARLLVDGGAKVALVSRRAEPLEALDVPGERKAIDLRAPDGCDEAVEFAADALGGLDGIVNAVGVVAFGPVAELSADTMEELFLTNTFVPIMLARAGLARLSDEGVFVNVSGIIAERSFPGLVAYAASKAAARSFDEGLAAEHRSRLRVIDARPPHTETGLVGHPIAGTSPGFPQGLTPEVTARRIVEAIANGEVDLPSGAFDARG